MVHRFLKLEGAPGSPEQTKPNQRCCKHIQLHPYVLPCETTEGAMSELLQEIKNDNESILQLLEQGIQQNTYGT